MKQQENSALVFKLCYKNKVPEDLTTLLNINDTDSEIVPNEKIV